MSSQTHIDQRIYTTFTTSTVTAAWLVESSWRVPLRRLSAGLPWRRRFFPQRPHTSRSILRKAGADAGQAVIAFTSGLPASTRNRAERSALALTALWSMSTSRTITASSAAGVSSKLM